MPGPGQKNVTISEELWKLAYNESKKENPENPNVAGWISNLILEKVKEAQMEKDQKAHEKPIEKEDPS